MSTSTAASKFPHPTRMLFEALRRRPDVRASGRELFEEIHRLYPSPKRQPGEVTPPTVLNGITIPTMRNENEYPHHPIPSYNQFKNSLLPYLAKEGLIQKFSYGSSGNDRNSQPQFAWRFNPSYPAPLLLPSHTPLPPILPPTTPSTLFRPIDADGLLAMPPSWDSKRKPVCLTPHQDLARKVGEWIKLDGVFARPPKVLKDADQSKRPPKGRMEQLRFDLKTQSGLNKRRQRNRVGKVLRFGRWKDQIEQEWAERGPEMVREGMEREKEREARRLLRQVEKEEGEQQKLIGGGGGQA